MAKISFGMVLV